MKHSTTIVAAPSLSKPEKADVRGFVRVRGAREHSLKNVNVEIPRDALVVFTVISGSGKSSLALRTLDAEAQRRYLEYRLSVYKTPGDHQRADSPDRIGIAKRLCMYVQISKRSPIAFPREARLLISHVSQPRFFRGLLRIRCQFHWSRLLAVSHGK